MDKKKHKKSLWKRYILLLLGLTTIAFGVAFSIKGNLGTSPVSSVPYVVSQFAPLTVGNVTIILHSLFVLGQLCILRREFTILNLAQVAVGVVFGYVTDFAVWATRGIQVSGYLMRWVFSLLGTVLVGLGVSLELCADVLMIAAEGLALAISKATGMKVGNVKIIQDVLLVVTAVTLSLVFLRGLHGVREGTVVSALLVGTCVKFFNKWLKPLEQRVMED